MASEILLSNLRMVFDVERNEQIPADVLVRCERVEELLQRVKPEGSFGSTQVLALLLEQREHKAREIVDVIYDELDRKREDE